MSQAFSYTGSHSSHCNYTYILYIGTFKEPPSDSFLLFYYIYFFFVCAEKWLPWLPGQHSGGLSVVKRELRAESCPGSESVLARTSTQNPPPRKFEGGLSLPKYSTHLASHTSLFCVGTHLLNSIIGFHGHFDVQTPGGPIPRKFAREGAAVSSCGVKESDHPLPSPRQSAKADLAAGTSPRRSAKAPSGDPPAGAHGAAGGAGPPGHTGPPTKTRYYLCA